MTQALYAHMKNKTMKILKKEKKVGRTNIIFIFK
jgi:hypothetical protein